jgi:L-lysine 2,3-aminomutase
MLLSFTFALDLNRAPTPSTSSSASVIKFSFGMLRMGRGPCARECDHCFREAGSAPEAQQPRQKDGVLNMIGYLANILTSV